MFFCQYFNFERKHQNFNISPYKLSHTIRNSLSYGSFVSRKDTPSLVTLKRGKCGYYSTTLDKCLNFMAFRGLILCRLQSSLSPRIDMNFRHLYSCDTMKRLFNEFLCILGL